MKILCFMVLCAVTSTSLSQDDFEFNRRAAFMNVRDDELAIPTPEDPDGDGVIGAAGKDYPVLKQPPETSFTCEDKLPGIYADMETGCQAYHVCQADLRKESSLCVNGTIFNQATFSCDWWYNVDCMASPHYYSLNADLGKESSILYHEKIPLRKIAKKLPVTSHKISIPLPPPPPPSLSFVNMAGHIPPPPPPPPRSRMRPLKKLRRPVSTPEIFIPPPPQFGKDLPERLPHPPPPPPPPKPVLTYEHVPTSRPRRLKAKAHRPQEEERRNQQRHVARSFSGPSDGRPRGKPRPVLDTHSYGRNAFDPSVHLPKPKPNSEKRLLQKLAQNLKVDRSPMMQPVRSSDVVSGYSDLYLNKPVDED